MVGPCLPSTYNIEGKSDPDWCLTKREKSQDLELGGDVEGNLIEFKRKVRKVSLRDE